MPSAMRSGGVNWPVNARFRGSLPGARVFFGAGDGAECFGRGEKMYGGCILTKKMIYLQQTVVLMFRLGRSYDGSDLKF